MQESQTKSSIFNGTNLKFFAVVLMVFDHIFQMWSTAGVPQFFNMLGRPVFPIFLFLMAESFFYTRSKKKLMTRLLIASLLMGAGNLLLNVYLLRNPDITLINNAFSTFFMTTVYMYAWDLLKAKKILKGIVITLLPILPALLQVLILNENTPTWLIQLFLLVPNILMVEGGFMVVILGLLFYIFREKRWIQILCLVLLSMGLFLLETRGIQWMMVFAAIPMALYDGKKGKGMKNFFYIFYPAHIYIFYILASLFSR